MPKTNLNDLINPEVMGDMINGKLINKIKFLPFATINKDLKGRAGDTITIPSYEYIGDAEDVKEGESISPTKLTVSTKSATIKKAMKAIEFTKEALESGYGDPLQQANVQLALSIASKIDNDCLECLSEATLTNKTDNPYYDPIGYRNVFLALDALGEEDFGINKVLFIHPKQLTQLRTDYEFLEINKYNTEPIMTGVVGVIAGCQVVPTNKIKFTDDHYENYIVQTSNEKDELPALSIILKSDVEVLTDTDIYSAVTGISANTLYTTVLTNPSKVVKCYFGA